MLCMLYIAIYFLFQKKKKHTLLILLSREENRLHLKRDYKYISRREKR